MRYAGANASYGTMAAGGAAVSENGLRRCLLCTDWGSGIGV